MNFSLISTVIIYNIIDGNEGRTCSNSVCTGCQKIFIFLLEDHKTSLAQLRMPERVKSTLKRQILSTVLFKGFGAVLQDSLNCLTTFI